MSKRKKWVRVIAGAFLVVIITACATQPQQAQSFPTENPYLEVPRVTLEEAKAAFDSGSAVFVDTRRGITDADSHIPGALLISIDDIESRMDELDPDQWIITYCT